MKKRRLRVAVLIRQFSFQAGGAERYAAALVRELAARHDIHVFAQELGAAIPGVTVHPVPLLCRRPRWLNQLYYAWWTWRRTRAGFDVVHSHDNVAHGDIQTVHVYPLRHLWFRDAHSAWTKARQWFRLCVSPRLLAYWWLERMRFQPQPGRWVVAVSEPVRQVMRHLPGARAPVTVIAPGIESTHPVEAERSATDRQAARASLGLSTEMTQRSLLLWVGNDGPKKGLPGLIEALSGLPRSVGLLLAGTSRPKALWQRQAQALGISDRIVDIGVRDDIAVAYRACDVLVHPTFEDTYGMVVHEAMSHGRAVVVSGPRHCGIAAGLTHGVNAYLLDDPGDVNALQQALATVLQTSVQQGLSHQALAWAQQHRWPEMAQALEDLYFQSLSERA